MSFDRSWHGTGTATVTNASTAVTGQGTTWQSFGIRQGDYFLAGGDMVPIASVQSNTGLTLTDAWPAATRTAQPYKIIPASDAVRTVVASREAIALLTNGNVSAISALANVVADRLPYYTGPGAAALAVFTPFARTLMDDADTAAAVATITGTGAAATRLAALCRVVADWNAAVENGWYMGNGAANAPGTGWFMGEVIAHNALYVTQRLHAFTTDTATDAKSYERRMRNGVWGAPLPIRATQGELDALYQAKLAYTPVQQGTGVGQLTNAIKMGWDNTRLRVTVDSADLGFAWLSGQGAQSLIANGYKRLPDGFIVQWGNSALASADVGVQFPLAFPSNCLAVTANVMSPGTAPALFCMVDQLNAASFVARVRSDAGAAVAATIRWMALGY
ncbi:MAG TPA: pyocin knob domain-containing protein [Mesorhizobium sp.]|jgi:hypothetical protein|nr:pyocin knob domain-containing protein [Mesorhizobium sp.]